jgi:hypothetical protein
MPTESTAAIPVPESTDDTTLQTRAHNMATTPSVVGQILDGLPSPDESHELDPYLRAANDLAVG